MDKTRTKQAVAARGIRVARGLVFDAQRKPTAAEVIAAVGESVVIKPNAEGSSVGLSLPATWAELEASLAGIQHGSWLAEERLSGREC